MDKFLTTPSTCRAFLAIGLLCTSTSLTTAQTSTLQNHEDVRRTARAYIEGNHPWQNLRHTVTAGNLDRRTRLQRCDGPLEAFLPVNRQIKQRTTVGVRCNGSQPWKVYLPVSVKAFAPVLVANRPIAPGAVIAAGDVETRERDITSLGYGYVPNIDVAGGYRSRMSIAQGAVLTPRMVESAVMIKKGQRVRLTRAQGPIQISMAAEAVSTAGLGERIQVRNASSGRVVEGRVTGAENVEITY